MTVCIAAICEYESRIVICSDTRLDASFIGSSEGNQKIASLGYGWVAMLAGDFVTVRDFYDQMKRVFLARPQPPPNKVSLVRFLKTSANAFMKSPLYRKHPAEIIVTGFIGDTAVIASVRIEEPEPVIDFAPAFRAIGSGGTIAEVFLNIRDCTGRDSLARTLYAVYEAKKYSEKSSSVGPETILYALAPLPSGSDKESAMACSLDDAEILKLEEMRRQCGLKKIVQLPFALPQFQVTR